MEERKPEAIPDGMQSAIPEESLQLGYEVRDANIGVIFWSGLTLAGVMILVTVIIGLFYWYLNIQYVERAGPPPPLLEEAQGLPPGPLLQRNPAEDMQEMQAENEAILNNYGWVDQEAGIVRIPITEAMKLTLERGLPTQPGSQ